MTLGDRERIRAEALDWNNVQIRGPENEELIYEPNQETPYTGWVVRRWKWVSREYIQQRGLTEVAVLSEEWEDEEIFQVRNGEREGVYTVWQ